ncbi:uncharacterized protein MYU51_008035 [Penicillium brevicompactum]
MPQSSRAAGSRRKWHSKSRTGCQTCRSRKIKCDERRPSCLNCTRKGLRCDFQTSESLTTTVQAPETLTLELLHHFTISTSVTLSPDPRVRDVWRVVVPQMAFTTDYILDGILALAALHIARYDSGRRHVLLPYAIDRHSASLSKALPQIPGVTAHNCTPLFVFGVLTLFFSLAQPALEVPTEPSSKDIIPEWLHLLRGIDAVVMAENSLFSSPVSLIFRSSWGSLNYWKSHVPEQHQVLADLEEKICTETSEDPERLIALREAVVTLNRSFSFLYGGNFKDQDKLRGFYEWLFEITDSYLHLLKNGDNGALCVLAFYAVLVRDLEKYWWIEGWAIRLIKGIYMLLDGEHRLWIRWAIEEIGWVPEIR